MVEIPDYDHTEFLYSSYVDSFNQFLDISKKLIPAILFLLMCLFIHKHQKAVQLERKLRDESLQAHLDFWCIDISIVQYIKFIES
jgi:hypothetical protein